MNKRSLGNTGFEVSEIGLGAWQIGADQQKAPDGFDYKMWAGTTPDAAQTAARCHFNFRWIDDYAPGYVTDWGAHFIDVAHWGMDSDNGGPIEIVANKVKRREATIYDAVESFDIRYVYPDNVELRMFSTENTSILFFCRFKVHQRNISKTV